MGSLCRAICILIGSANLLFISLLVSSPPARAWTFQSRHDFEANEEWTLFEEIVGGDTRYGSGIGSARRDTGAAYAGSWGMQTWANESRALKSNHVIASYRYRSLPTPDTVCYELCARMLSDKARYQSGIEFSVQSVVESGSIFVTRIVGCQYLPGTDSWNVWANGQWTYFMTQPMETSVWYSLALEASFGSRRTLSLRIRREGGGLDTTVDLSGFSIASESRGQTSSFCDISVENENVWSAGQWDSDAKTAYDSISLTCEANDTDGPNVWYVNDAVLDANDSWTTAAGNNANSGVTPDKPLLTLNAAFQRMGWCDTLRIDAGVFTPGETLSLRSGPAWIVGVDSAKTVIDFADSSDAAFRSLYVSQKDSVHVSDLGVRGGWAGIYLRPSSGSTIRRTRTANCKYGMVIESSNECVVASSVAETNSQTGIHLTAADRCEIDGVIARSNNVGVGLYNGADSNVIRRCGAASNTLYGYHVNSSSESNFFYSNSSSANGQIGFILQGGGQNILDSNSSVSEPKAYWIGADSNTVKNSSAESSTLWSFEVNGVRGTSIEQCRASQSQQVGFLIFGAAGTAITGNTAYRCGNAGFVIRDTSTGCIVTGNLSSGNSADGYYVDTLSTSPFIFGNLAETNAENGILIRSSSATLVRNLVRGNRRNGLSLENAQGVAVTGNEIDSNGGVGYFGLAMNGGCSAVVRRNNIRTGGGETNAVSADTILDVTRNWWGSVDSTRIRSLISGTSAPSARFAPFRLGEIDTAAADTVAPDAMAAPTRDTGYGFIRLTWAASASNEDVLPGAPTITLYRVHRARSAAPESWARIAETTATSWIDTSVLGDTDYFYAVTAVDDRPGLSNESWYSPSVSGRTVRLTADFDADSAIGVSDLRLIIFRYRSLQSYAELFDIGRNGADGTVDFEDMAELGRRFGQ